MERIAKVEIIRAAANADFERFSDALFRYGCLAGKCFASVQGGAFCSQQTAELIAWLRQYGVAGVGQSSWGPTVFALMPNQHSADQLAHDLVARAAFTDYEVLVAPPANQGATVSC
jgi:predicted sugar kinase